MRYLYGNFSNKQININVQLLHNDIHKLLLYKEPNNTREIFQTEKDFLAFFNNLLYRLGGFDSLLDHPVTMVSLLSTLQAAYDMVTCKEFNYKEFRRLIFDSHGYVKEIFEEV